jgi:6-phosphogluconolactonase (cycloisomerase 2 family)
MRNLFRVLMGLLALMALVLLAACGGAPGCPQAGFGSSTPCTQGSGGNFGTGGTGGGGGGGGGTAPSAFAYVIDQVGTIDGYALNTNAGTFTTISSYTAPTIPPNEGGVGMAVAQGQYLYAAVGSVDEIFEYTISPTGTLTAVSQSPFPASYLTDFVSGVGQANMIVNPLGTLLFASDELGEKIHVYSIATGGALTEVTGSPFSCPGGFTPMNLATDGSGLYLYAIDGNFTTHQGAGITIFSIGTGTNLGVLTPVAGSPFIGAPYNMWQLKGEPTGQFMVGTTGSSVLDVGFDDDNLYLFSIAKSGGASAAGTLTLIDTQSTSTYSPFSIAVQSNVNGNLVYSLGFTDNSGTLTLNPIEGFSITSGALSADTSSPFSVGEGTWGQFDQNGVFLLTYVSGQTSTGTTVTQLTPLAVASDGTLTQAASAATLTAPGFWVVTDPQ